jgi:alpha-L-fucosidase
MRLVTILSGRCGMVAGFALALTVATAAPVTLAQSAPKATEEEVDAAVRLTTPAIPADATFQPNWDSLKRNGVPQWLADAKFGIMMHWGLYSSTSTHNEWDEKYIYGSNAAIARQFSKNFGPLDQFGYLDVLDPQKGPNATGAAAYAAAGGTYSPFTAARFDPKEWAMLFKAAGAKYVTVSAEHHDGFALWNSKVTPFNTVNFGPHRDLVGAICDAVRAQGMKFGVQNHEIENYDFIAQGVQSGPVGPGVSHTAGDLIVPNDFAGTLTYVDKNGTSHTLKRSDFYRPDLRASTDSNDALTHFLVDWYQRSVELIDQYHPDSLYFDNGINPRVLDPLKQKLAAYYFNQALTWPGKPQVTIAAKQKAYLSGATEDYEKRIPTSIQDEPFQTEETMTNGSAWDYTLLGGKNSGFNTRTATFVHYIAHIASLNGSLVLNFAPEPDGTIPTAEQDVFKDIGKWLSANGDGIYGTHPWIHFAEGSSSVSAHSSADFRFSTKGSTLYAIMMGWPSGGSTAAIHSLGKHDLPRSEISGIKLLGYGPVKFVQNAGALTISLPDQKELAAPEYAYTFAVEGSNLQIPAPHNNLHH